MLKDLPLSALHVHADHIPSAKHRDYQYLRLLQSVKVPGLLLPLLVTERDPDNYLIIDGARRYFCANELGLETLPCVVKPALSDRDCQVLRFELYHRVEPWNSQEYADWLKRLPRA
jgi:ParB-like chromosome segregation protein Spo0J